MTPPSHYGVIVFSGDPACEHPDEELYGKEPSLTFIAQGSEDFCWEHLARWTANHPLRMWEDCEVLARTRSRAIAHDESVP